MERKHFALHSEEEAVNRGRSGGPVWWILDELGSHSSRAEGRARQRIARLKPDVFPELVRALRHHPNAYARSVAASALIRFGGRTRPALLRALRDPSMPVRLHALLALGRVWDRTVASAVIRLLGDPSGGVRINAIAVLARRRVKGAAGALVRRLDDSKWYVRQQAARALGELGVVRARAALMRAALGPRKAVRDAAGEALARIERAR